MKKFKKILVVGGLGVMMAIGLALVGCNDDAGGGGACSADHKCTAGGNGVLTVRCDSYSCSAYAKDAQRCDC